MKIIGRRHEQGRGGDNAVIVEMTPEEGEALRTATRDWSLPFTDALVSSAAEMRWAAESIARKLGLRMEPICAGAARGPCDGEHGGPCAIKQPAPSCTCNASHEGPCLRSRVETT